MGTQTGPISFQRLAPRTRVFSVICHGGGPLLSGTEDYSLQLQSNRDNRLTPCQAYQQGLSSSNSEFTVFVHDDVDIHDAQWLYRVIGLFDTHPNCVAVGLGGATSLGRPLLYKRPYRIWDLARGGYMSNQSDWAIHGAHETGVRRVAVLDAFFMAVRTEWLRSRGGWPVDHLSHHCLDLWLACEAARDSKEIYMVGAACTHHGGKSSTSAAYADAKWLLGGSLESEHTLPHEWIYREYRDVLPISVEGL